MAVESLAINIWLKSVLSVNETLNDLLGEPFNTASVIKRKTNYQINNGLYVPIVSNGRVYKISVAGRTGTNEPTFPGLEDETIIDGTVTWIESGEVGTRPRVFEGVAPSETKEPFIVFNLQDLETNKRVGKGGSDLFGTYTYQVKGTDRGNDKTTLSKIADTVDDILNIGEGEGGYDVTFNGKVYEIMGCYRDLPIDFSEIVDEQRFNHMGGLYPILIMVKQ